MPLNLGERRVLLFDAGLSILFFQHCCMIRRPFRSSLERLIPEKYYSAFYAIVSCIVLLMILVFWQGSDRAFAAFHGISYWIFRSMYLASLVGFTWGARVLKFFDSFGISQIMNFLHGRKPGQMPFIVKDPYQWVHLPLYFFTLLVIWSCPKLTMDRLMFNFLWTIWISVGALLEEQDLIADFGSSYIEYKRRVPMLIPYKFSARHFVIINNPPFFQRVSCGICFRNNMLQQQDEACIFKLFFKKKNISIRRLNSICYLLQSLLGENLHDGY